jgi:SAM-dependent methyltransferase
MLGQTIDYYLLRTLAHNRNRATNEELERKMSPFDPTLAANRLNKLIKRFDGHFPIGARVRYLDVGCGGGELSLAILLAGGGHVTGIDIEPRHLAVARQRAKQTGLEARSRFVVADINDWTPNDAYDVVFSHEALEHIHHPNQFLRRIGDFLKPNGVMVLGFGPLFHSPVGDHMDAFFRVPIPWRGVLFSELAILRLRSEMFRPDEPVARFENIVGGLNRMRFSEFLTFASADYDFEFLDVNPQLKRLPLPLKAISDLAIRLPFFRDYVASSVYAVLRRRKQHPPTYEGSRQKMTVH